MKVRKLLLLPLAAALLLSGCARLDRIKQVELPPLPEAEASAEPTAAVSPTPQPDTDVVPTQAPHESSEPEEPIILRFETVAEERFDPAEGKQLILTFSYVTPKVRIPGREAAAAAINEAVAILDESYYTGEDYGEGYNSGFNGMLEAAEDNFAYIVGTGETGLPMEFASTRNARCARADEEALSLIFDTYEYTGGAHGMLVRRAYVYDTQSGERLSLDDLSDDPVLLRETLVEQMLRALETDEELALHVSDAFVDPADYPSAFAALLREGSWYLDAEGLAVFSDLYELGPYAAGMAEFLIPYESLTDCLSPRWLPSVRHSGGSVSVKPLREWQSADLTVVDRLELDAEAEEICLMCSGPIYDLRLTRVGYGEPFYEIGSLWACSYMENCALVLRSFVPEIIPDLQISYTGPDGHPVRLLLTQSGRDGSYLLIDEESFG